MSTVPAIRVRPGNKMAFRQGGDFVLYWMTSFRRLEWNYALQHAADLARSLRKPLIVLEILKLDYPYASPRFHRFLLDGIGERGQALAGSGAYHLPFVEKGAGEGDALLAALGENACCVVTDDFPSFFLPAWIRKMGRKLPVRLELVDSNGLLPLRAPEGKVFSAAYHFRRYLQKTLPEHLPESPDPSPLKAPLPQGEISALGPILRRWPTADPELLSGTGSLTSLPLPDGPPPVSATGTGRVARDRLRSFLGQQIHRYADDRNHPDLGATTGLSPYLHFGLISVHEIFHATAGAEGWTPLRLSTRTDGKREGWWGMGEGAEAFLDQLITWRELGFNGATYTGDYTAYGSLPEWARITLAAHAGDERPHLYDLERFRQAQTHDPLWNAAQRQLLREGIIHNYLRMLWGKKILEWSASPEEALDTMLELNDGMALDGRDPNSYSGIFWCLGRYDRGWPERPVFGKVRSMSSRATRRKVKVEEYLKRFSSHGI